MTPFQRSLHVNPIIIMLICKMEHNKAQIEKWIQYHSLYIFIIQRKHMNKITQPTDVEKLRNRNLLMCNLGWKWASAHWTKSAKNYPISNIAYRHHWLLKSGYFVYHFRTFLGIVRSFPKTSGFSAIFCHFCHF